jgi:predicted transcriptional regulator
MSIGIEVRESSPSIGLLTRTPKLGPELDMIKREITGLTKLFVQHDLEIAVFWEPKVDVGFPDLVLALFVPNAYTRWPKIRSTLTATDLKIVHQLFNSREMSSVSLEKKLGYSNLQVKRSIERLLDSGLVRRADSQWRLRSFAEIYGVRKLIAIEAKLANWTEAFMQAKTNMWFASESYVLSPVLQPRSATQDQSAAHSVGILTCGSGRLQKVVRGTYNRLPASYASWQFNEWIGRALNQ